nr:maltodextrin glucosidase [Lacticaseibacillus chiayiensis]
MHQGSKKQQYRIPRSLLYSGAVLSLTATAIYCTSTIPVSAVKADPGTSKATAKATTGNLQIVSVTKQAHYFEITYSNNLKARLFILANNQFRFYADPSGKFAAPAQSGDGLNAKIFTKTVDTSATKPFDAAQLSNDAKGWQIQTKAITIDFDKAAATLQVLQGNKVVMAEQQPLAIAGNQTTQILKRSGQDHFFGGGTQNGNFTLTGKKIKIQNTNNWVDGGVASPNPFYWSTAGYGVVRNTFTPGTYDFDAAGDGQVKTTHQEERFDAVYFFDAKPSDLLKDYYDLTGAPAMMPRYGFYEAHLNAYNRDTWVPVSADTPGAIKFEDGKYYKEYQPAKAASRSRLTAS